MVPYTDRGRQTRFAENRLRCFLDRLGAGSLQPRLELSFGHSSVGGIARCGFIRLEVPTHEGNFWAEGGLGLRILAHEAAHVAQLALSCAATASTCEVEREADRAIEPLLRDEPFRCELRPKSNQLHWNRAGHYYTIYYLSLVAGATETEAMRMAFFGQTPDLVSELDAPTQTAFQAQLKDSWGSTAADVAVATNYTTSDPGKVPTDWEVCTDVIEGLHCLTGASVAQERSKRSAILATSGWGSLEFGIGLHAYGDAFAHCTGGSMYGPHHGHLFAGHDPDSIHLHIAEYKTYAQGLLSILNIKTAGKPRTQEKVALDGLASIAQRWNDNDDELNQIRDIRGLINDLSTQKALVAYEPPNTCIGWQAFLKTPYAGNFFKPDDIDRILALGRQWRASRPDPRPAAAREKIVKDRIEMQSRMMDAGPKF